MRIALFLTFTAILTTAWGQAPDGKVAFQTRCSVCHGTDGNGGEHAPTILPSLATKNDEELTTIIRDGVPRKGMPAFKELPDAEVVQLVAYLRSLQPRRGRRGFAPVRQVIKLNLNTWRRKVATTR